MLGSATVNPVKRTILLAQAAWAARTVRLAPEPEGERSGIARERLGATLSEYLRLVAVGDSLVAGSGASSQATALTPRIADRVAAATGAPVIWETHARLGSTMRRVRHRFLDEVEGRPDILFVCAGSNDIMARRSRAEWTDDLEAVLGRSLEMAAHVVLCSAGQPHNSPRLPAMLRRELAKRIDAQTADSKSICARLGVDYADVAHADLVEGFWASDGFHPSEAGYEQAAGMVVGAMGFLPQLRR